MWQLSVVHSRQNMLLEILVIGQECCCTSLRVQAKF